MNGQTRAKIDDRMLQRVCGEFLEMPGLRLTCKQAQRLWGLDEPTCRELLEYLVDAKFLRPAGPGCMRERATESPTVRVCGWQRTDSHDRTAEPVKEAS